MSSKTVRKSAASSTGTASQSQHQTPSSSSQAQSPMTPTRMSRIQEKNQLASLNDRLAAYIERNQTLENENIKLNRVVSQSEEHTQKTITRMSRSFDKELAEARRLVDETAKDKAKLVFEHEQIKKDYDDARIKLDKKTKELTSAQKLNSSLSAQVENLSRDASAAIAERDRLLEERADLVGEVERLAKENESLRKKFETETMKAVEAENKLKSKTEELNYKIQQKEEMFEELRTRRSVEIQEVGGQIQQEYELKLQQSIQELREEYENQIRANKDELEGLYQQKMSGLHEQLTRAQSSTNSKQDEVRELSHSITTLTANLQSLETERNELNDQLKNLRKKLQEDQTRFLKILQDRDLDIDKLAAEKSDLLNQYQDLMDIKVGLDNEISMYRKLLEGEERRLSISPPSGRGGGGAGFGDETPLLPPGRAQLRSGLKRKRGTASALDEFQSDEAATYETNDEANGDIQILEDDTEGKFVKLRNNGDREISLSGWTLTRKTVQGETTHKFHRSVKLEAGGESAIYSAEVQGILNEPPTTILMKQKWFTGDTITTTLNNSQGELMAKRETKKVTVSYSRRRMGTVAGGGSRAEELFQQEGDGQGGERCVIC